MTIFNTDKWYETKIAEAEKQKLEAEVKLANFVRIVIFGILILGMIFLSLHKNGKKRHF